MGEGGEERWGIGNPLVGGYDQGQLEWRAKWDGKEWDWGESDRKWRGIGRELTVSCARWQFR